LKQPSKPATLTPNGLHHVCCTLSITVRAFKTQSKLGDALNHRNLRGDEMYWLNDNGPPHYVSIRTGKKYFFREDGQGHDRQRALKQLERDDTPAPEPEPEPVRVVPVRPRPMDFGAQARIQLDEMRSKQ